MRTGPRLRAAVVGAWALAMAVPLLAPLAFPGRAQAQPALSPDDEAQRHFDRGTTAYNLGRFEEAIAEYRRAYEVKVDPAFLFNIAQAYRQLGVDDQALFFYKRYLSTHPAPPNRIEVEVRISEIEPAVAAKAGADPNNGPRAAHQDVGLLHPGTRPEAGAAAPPTARDNSILRRWWFWAGLVAVAAAGFTTAALLSGREPETKIPPSDLGHARFF